MREREARGHTHGEERKERERERDDGGGVSGVVVARGAEEEFCDLRECRFCKTIAAVGVSVSVCGYYP